MTTRIFAWLGIGLAGLSLVASAVSRASGGSVGWTAWAGPLLIVANVGVYTFGILRSWPRVARVFAFLTIAVALAIVVAQASRIPW